MLRIFGMEKCNLGPISITEGALHDKFGQYVARFDTVLCREKPGAYVS